MPNLLQVPRPADEGLRGTPATPNARLGEHQQPNRAARSERLVKTGAHREAPRMRSRRDRFRAAPAFHRFLQRRCFVIKLEKFGLHHETLLRMPCPTPQTEGALMC